METNTNTPEAKQPASAGCHPTPCSAFLIGQEVIYQGVKRIIYDIDEGYGVLALDGDKYISPADPENRCIEANFYECNPVLKIQPRKYKRVPEAVEAAYKLEDQSLIVALAWTESYLHVLESRVRNIFDDNLRNEVEESERLRSIFLPNV
jgi:hypothetical protein